ncbi:hypothetical protein [Streptomyces roseifaciens]|uniref:hypothetical protein n=1 Tax=Streptomyces roseifaciens TaxID=1488406 RepID=UPI000B1DD5F5|nr:hypothetical protein [Streptomyces roseifaciens]
MLRWFRLLWLLGVTTPGRGLHLASHARIERRSTGGIVVGVEQRALVEVDG